MKNSKKRGVLGVGRRFFLTHTSKSQRIKNWLLKWGAALALFLLVFAAVSIVKIHAGTEHNISGWLGGWSEDGVGNYTGVGWISMNNTNPDIVPPGTFSYGVNIPNSDGPITGTNNYAWSPNIGWVSFNSGDLGGCPSGTCNARREGDYLKGWARIVGIKDNLSNAGGWEGWIKLSSESGDPFSYGIKINNDGTFVDCNPSSSGIGCAWSGENIIAGVLQGFGWVDFSGAKYTARCDSISLNDPIRVKAGSSADMTVSRDPSGLNAATVVTLTNQAPAKINNPPANVTINSGEDFKTFSFTAKTFQGAADQCEDTVADAIKADVNCGSDLGTVIVERVCNVACSPAKTDVTAGGSEALTAKSTDYSGSGSSNFTWEIVENSSCASLGSCSGDSCDVTTKQQDSSGNSCAFKKVKVKASNCCGSATCELDLGQTGWIETNP